MANYIVLRRLKVSYLSYINAESLMCCLFPSSHLVSCPMNDKRGRRRSKPLMIPVNLDFNRALLLMTFFTALLHGRNHTLSLRGFICCHFTNISRFKELTKEFWLLRQFLVFWYWVKSNQKCISVCLDYLNECLALWREWSHSSRSLSQDLLNYISKSKLFLKQFAIFLSSNIQCFTIHFLFSLSLLR